LIGKLALYGYIRINKKDINSFKPWVGSYANVSGTSSLYRDHVQLVSLRTEEVVL